MASASTRPTPCSSSTSPTATSTAAMIETLLSDGAVVICDRYLASSIAYGEAQGLDPAWLEEIQRYLPRPDLTIVLDIAPDTAVQRKSDQPRPLRAGSRAAVARARQLPASEHAGGLDPVERRTRQERGLGRRHRCSRDAARAAVSARTSRAPAPAAHGRTRPASLPSCSHRRPPRATEPRSRAAPAGGRRRRPARCGAARLPAVRSASPSCAGAAARGRTGTPTCAARSAAWLKPRV